MKREKEIQFSEEILITKSDLEEKQNSLQDLTKQVICDNAHVQANMHMYTK
jgi:hypothetical protein